MVRAERSVVINKLREQVSFMGAGHNVFPTIAWIPNVS